MSDDAKQEMMFGKDLSALSDTMALSGMMALSRVVFVARNNLYLNKRPQR